MIKLIALPFVLFSHIAYSEVAILQEKKEDLNKDGKKDSIAWVANSKEDKRPARLVIRMPGTTLLDLSGNFCAPGEKASDCVSLSVEKRLTSRREPILIFKSGESTYTYRWQKNAFRPYLASWITKSERHEINYSTGRVLVTSSKKTETCPLKNTRNQEDLSNFTLYDIRQESDCQASAQ